MKKILVPVDFSDVTGRVVDTAATVARAMGGSIVLLNVEQPEPDFVGYDPGPDVVRVSVAHDIEADKKKLEALKTKVTGSGVEARALLVQGPAVEKILSETRKLRADLLVMGSHGHGAVYNLLVGSVTEGVLKKAEVPVLVVPAERKQGGRENLPHPE